MVRVSIYLDKRFEGKDNTFPVKIRVTHKKEFYISTNIRVKLNQWDVNQSVVINTPQKTAYNNLLNAKKIEVESIALDLDKRNILDTLDHKQLQKLINESLGKVTAKEDISLFTSHFKKFAETKTAPRTKDIYLLTLSHIDKFTDGSQISWEQINYAWLTDFVNYLTKNGNKTNTIAIHLRNIRSVFNDAINRDIIQYYPFRKFKIKTERTAKRSLTVEQLRTLRDYECQEHQVKYRDIFMLIFYMIGINMVDLLNLKEIKNGRVEFRRAKTGRLYSIAVELEALKIINKYKGKDFLLDVMDVYKDYQNFLHRMNKNLQEIGPMVRIKNAAKDPKYVKCNKKDVTPIFPEITTYWARHTWATIAAGLDIPKETIAAALGHGGNDVTDIYIRFDEKKIDKANRKVINYLFNDKK